MKKALIIAALGLVGAAQAQVTIYDATTATVTNFLAPGGATLQGTNTITNLIADDVNVIGGFAGNDVTSFSFELVNNNAASVSFRPRVRFWNADGAGGAPGTYYSQPSAVGFTFNAVTMAANTATTFTGTLAANSMKVPSATMWFGITFDDNSGATLITAAQLNNIGVAVGQPTVGTSADQIFTTTAAGSYFNVANPAGALSSPFSGNPPANLGFKITTAAVPEPASMAVLGLGAIAMIRRRRSKKA